MKITIEIANGAKRNKAIKGSLYINEDGDANFRQYAHSIKKDEREKKYKKLAHGKVTHYDDETYVNLHYKHDEGIKVSEALYDEAWEARKFMEDLEDSFA